MTSRGNRYLAEFNRVLGQGQGIPHASIIGTLLIVLICFFYAYTAASYFDAIVYILKNRVIYEATFEKHVVSRDIDHIILLISTFLWLVVSFRAKPRFILCGIYGAIIVGTLVTLPIHMRLQIAAVLSLPLIISILLCYCYAFKRSVNIRRTLSINYVAILGVALGILAFIVEISNVVFRLPQGTQFPSIRSYAYELFSLFSVSSPFLMILLIFSFPIKLLINELFPRKLKLKNDRFDALFSFHSIKTRTKIIFLALFCLLSVGMVIIPHQPTINKDNQDVGVDTHYYVDWINILIQSNSATEFLRQAFIIIHDGDRPLALLFLYSIVKIINVDPSIAIEYIPVLLGPALVLVTYFLTRELTSKNDLVSLLAAFLTAVSFHTLIGIYAGFYANWFAIIIGYLSFVFFFRFLKMPDRKNFVLYSILSILLLLSHVYTWTILALVTVIFLLIMLKLKYYHRRTLILLLLVVFCGALFDIGRTLLTGSSSGFEQDMQVANLQGGSIVDQFALRWANLMDTLTKYAGLYSNFIILILGVSWLFLANIRQQSTIFLVSFLSVGILPLFFGNWVILSRVFFDIPFQIPAAIALAYIKKQENGNLLFLAICIWLVAISIRAVAHFYFIAPLN